MKHNSQFAQIMLGLVLCGLFSCQSARQPEASNTDYSDKNAIVVLQSNQQIPVSEAASGTTVQEEAPEMSADASQATITPDATTEDLKVSDAVVPGKAASVKAVNEADQLINWKQAATQKSTSKKLSLGQKLVLKKINKLMKASDRKTELNANKPLEAKQSNALDHNLKLALIFALVSIILGLFSWLLGFIFGVVALVFLLLWILSL